MIENEFAGMQATREQERKNREHVKQNLSQQIEDFFKSGGKGQLMKGKVGEQYRNQ